MFTVCPNCHRQFRIYAEHLAAAGGQVRCGFCHHQFNAIDRLYDKPQAVQEMAAPFTDTPTDSPEPEFEIPDIDTSPQDAVVETVIDQQDADTDIELQRAIDEIGVEQRIAAPAEESQQAPAEINADALADDAGAEPARQTEYRFDDEEEAVLEPPANRSWLMTGFWSLATVIALLVIAGQLAWFNRDRLMFEYPQLRPYVKHLCQRYDCSVIRQRDTRAIKLINRDVRLHPSYQDTLLVNATMKNELATRQPYPNVQLTLFDTAGTMLGYREFAPGDYLDNSIDIDQGMPVDAPVHLVLEVSGSSAEAVSFEFRFM